MATYVWLRGHFIDQIFTLMNGCHIYNNSVNTEIFILHKDYNSRYYPFYKATSCLPEFLNLPFPFANKNLFPEFDEKSDDEILNILGEVQYKNDYILSNYISNFTSDENQIENIKATAKQCSLKKKMEVKDKRILGRDLLIIPTRGHLVNTPEFTQYLEYASQIKDKKLYVFSNNSKNLFHRLVEQYIDTENNDVIINDNPDNINWKLGETREQNLEMQRNAFQIAYDLSHCENLLYPTFTGNSYFSINYLRDIVIFMKNLGVAND